ncbi:MAG: peptidoglycan-binding protein [Planctomycetota bacterium]
MNRFATSFNSVSAVALAALVSAPLAQGQSQPTLRQGSRGAAVRTLQTLLKQRGFDPGPIDGIFGNMTLAAVRRFQSARRLVVDGVVGPQTWGALNAAPAAPAPAPAPATSAGTALPTRPATLRQGSRGGDVVLLQNLLRSSGFNPGPSDGDFGPQTAGKVRAFQSALGLTVDGVVGPQTWGALYPVLRQGARGASVRTLQTLLQQAGANPGPVDGDFGTMTLAAVRRFQSSRGLGVDGVVAGQTWTALLRGGRAPAPSGGGGGTLADFSRRPPAASYGRVRLGGVTVNLRTRELLERATWIMRNKYGERGFAFSFSQGSYSSSVAASGGTHSGGGAVDIRTVGRSRTTVDRMVLALREAGFAAWSRGRGFDSFAPHIHAIALNDAQASGSARVQMSDYRRGRNGLANKGLDPDRNLGRPIPQWAR